jgi:hypothetical protein
MPIPSPEEINANHKTFEQMGLLRWEDGKNHQLPQDFADMLGWKEMADIAYQAWVTLPDDEKSKTLIFTDNYGQVGALNYYNRKRTPKAYSFNTDYLFWFPENIEIQNMIFVGSMNDFICGHFNKCILVGQVENQYARERGTAVYQLLGAKDSTNYSIHQLVSKRKTTQDCF